MLTKAQGGMDSTGQFNYMSATPDAKMPTPADTGSLPILTPSTGYSDTGVSHEGDLGGAQG